MLCVFRLVLNKVIGGWKECNQKYLKSLIAFCQLNAIIVWHNWLWWWNVPPTVFYILEQPMCLTGHFVIFYRGFNQIQCNNGQNTFQLAEEFQKEVSEKNFYFFNSVSPYSHLYLVCPKRLSLVITYSMFEMAKSWKWNTLNCVVDSFFKPNLD